MTCDQCGTRVQTRRENYRYDVGGLSGITLAGVEVHRCPRCGNEAVTIPRIGPLHETITRALLEKPAPLAPEEVRWLRKRLEWAGAELATYMGTTRETVSRWETGAHPMGPAADRLLRLLVATALRVKGFTLDTLAAIDPGALAEPLRLRLRFDGESWQTEAVDGEHPQARPKP